MPALEKEAIQEIIDAVDIVEVASKYVSLKKVGSNYAGLSPFKNESVPSFFVSPSKKIFKCFSSGLGGNVIKLVSLLEGISYNEAAKKLAQEYGLNVKIQEEDQYYNIMKDIALFFNEELHKTKIAVLYLKKRGLYDIANEFTLGYSPQNITRLYNLLIQKYKEEDVLETQLFIKRENQIISYMAGRIVIPIADFYGRTINMSGRILTTSNDMKKYIFMKTNNKNNIRNLLFNLNKAKEYIKQQNEVIITEGAFDCMAVYKSGHKNVVALLGTGFSHEQMRMIKRHANVIYLALDPDATGEKTAIRIAKEYANDFVFYIYNPSESEDIDITLNKNKNALQENKVLFSTYLRYKYEKAELAQDKIKYKKHLEEFIKNISSKDVRSFYEEDYKTLNVEIKKAMQQANLEKIIYYISNNEKEKLKEIIKNDLDYKAFAFVLKNFYLNVQEYETAYLFSKICGGYNFNNALKNRIRDFLVFMFLSGYELAEAVNYFNDEISSVVLSFYSLAESELELLEDFSVESFIEYLSEKNRDMNEHLDRFLAVLDNFAQTE